LSRNIAPNHPEKILLVRRSFALEQEEEHLALLTALLEACRYCQNLNHRDELVELLAQPRYVNAPGRAIRNSLIGPFQSGHGRKVVADDLHVFFHEDVNRPTFDKLDWIIQEMRRTGWVSDEDSLSAVASQRLFRTELFDRALSNLPPINLNPTPKKICKPTQKKNQQPLILPRPQMATI
jgi:hypothetical protein